MARKGRERKRLYTSACGKERKTTNACGKERDQTTNACGKQKMAALIRQANS